MQINLNLLVSCYPETVTVFLCLTRLTFRLPIWTYNFCFLKVIASFIVLHGNLYNMESFIFKINQTQLTT